MNSRPITQMDFKESEDLSFYTALAALYPHGRECKPNQPFYGIIISDKYLSGIIKVASANISAAEEPLFRKTRDKWFVEQGGSFSYEQVTANLPEYYAERTVDEEGMNVVLSNITTYYLNIARIYLPCDDGKRVIAEPRRLYNCYTGDHKSNGGITYNGDRRSKEARIKGVKYAISEPLNYDKVGCGLRYKDSKYRNIFNDSFANYFREASVFKNMFDWWATQPFNHTYSDIECAQIIASLRAKSCYCGDYKMMDGHYSLPAFQATVETMGSLSGYNSSELSWVSMHSEEIFYTDLVVGDRLFLGKHNLYSGIYPTHDSESFQNFSILAYTAMSLGFRVKERIGKLKADEVFILVCGDDSAVFFGRKLSQDEVSQFSKLHAKTSSWFGQEMELTKTDYSDEVCTFCKKTFALAPSVKSYKIIQIDNIGVPVPKYPALKCVNALYHPEHIPHFSARESLIVWFCSIMDCSYGTTQWKGTVIAIAQQNPTLFGNISPDLAIPEEDWIELSGDYWFREYAQFELPNSPTFKLLCSLHRD